VTLMSLKWRWTLMTIVLATLFGAFIPNAPSSAPAPVSRTVISLAEEVYGGPLDCIGTTCNKALPAPTMPPTSMAALCALVVGILAYAATRWAKRRRVPAPPLQRGRGTVPFRPPQLSSFD
jgi:hypothetical protein